MGGDPHGMEFREDWVVKVNRAFGGTEEKLPPGRPLRRGWTESEHEIVTIRAEYEHYLFSIYILEEHLKSLPDDYYDLIIIHSGWVEKVCHWTRDIFESITLDHFDEKKLTRPLKADIFGDNNRHDKYG